MSSDFLSGRRQALEESFYRRLNAELVKQMKDQIEGNAQRADLASVSGISDDQLLDRLIALEMTAETVAALSLVPLVQVAWADGKLDTKERDAILSAAVESGITKDSAAYRCLLKWLEEPSEEALYAAWRDYVQALVKTLDDAERSAVRDGLLARTRQVAEAAGGILGFGNKVSESEQAVLDDLQAAFDAT